MKFLSRFLIVSAVAVGLGFLLYLAVQALPGDSRATNPSVGEVAPPNGSNAPENSSARPDRPENNRVEGIRWRAIARIARRTFVFAVIVFVTVLAKTVVFGRESNAKRPAVFDIFKRKKSRR
jgi:hypothetical protein